MVEPLIADATPEDVIRRWRLDTPGTADRVHLNNAGAGLMPRAVIDAIQGHIELEARIGGYEAAATVGDRVEATHAAIATLVGAQPRNIAIVDNATVAVAQALAAFDFNPGDVILTTQRDYTSNQLMYLALARQRGVDVIRADDLPTGGVDPESVRALVQRHRPRLVALTWIPTNGGLVQDAEAVGAICREAGVPYLVDACQAVGQLAIDVEQLGCDFLAATARKFLRGPRGIGFLHVSDRILQDGAYPLSLDMRGADLVDADSFELATDARRFENWEFAYALVLGMGAAVRYALDVGISTAGARALALAGLVRHELAAMPGASLIEPGTRLSAIVTVAFDGWAADALVAALRAEGINTSAAVSGPGPFYGRGAAGTSMLRISPHYYNTADEVRRALDAVAALTAGESRFS